MCIFRLTVSFETRKKNLKLPQLIRTDRMSSLEIRQASRHSLVAHLPVAVRICTSLSTECFPRTLINEKFPARRFSFAVSIKARSSQTPHGAAVTSLRETRYRHEKITGNFSRGAQGTKAEYVRERRWPECVRAMLFIPVNSYVHAPVYTRACLLYVGAMHAVTFETLQEGIARYESALARCGMKTRVRERRAWRPEVNSLPPGSDANISFQFRSWSESSAKKNVWKRSASRKCESKTL